MGEQVSTPLKHSGFGIASFRISLWVAFLEIIFILSLTPLHLIFPKAGLALPVIVGLCMFSGLIPSLVGVGLGIAGLMQKNRKKVFSILGLIFNLIISLGLMSPILISIFFIR